MFNRYDSLHRAERQRAAQSNLVDDEWVQANLWHKTWLQKQDKLSDNSRTVAAKSDILGIKENEDVLFPHSDKGVYANCFLQKNH